MLLHGQPGLASDWQLPDQLPRELRAFLTEQRALVRELGELISALRGIRQPVLLLADPHDTLIPARTVHQLATVLPNARVRLLDQISHHLPRRGAPKITAAIVDLLAALNNRPASA